MSPTDLILCSMAACAVGAVLALGLSSRRRASSFAGAAGALASSSLAMAATIQVARGGASPPAAVWSLPGWGSSLRLHVDGLSAVFVGLIAVVGLLAAIYSIGYTRHEAGRKTGWYWFCFLLFVSGMYGVVTVTDLMLFFCLFWQVMTIPSYALVRFDGRKRENVRAANRYLLLMEVSCALVMGGAAVLAPESGGDGISRFDFESIAAGFPATAAAGGTAATIGLLLFLCGFGMKAGMWPFGQLWLPDAHPAAPSPVSALLSGVMIKTGVYGILRTFLWLLPAHGYDPRGWGLVISILGTVTLLVGTVQALRQEQAKRLLAYSSIGQVGYIILAVGAALSLLGAEGGEAALVPLAAIAFHGALFHALNHGLFKGLLFLNAGSVLVATGTQDLDRLGGLLRLMPVTGWTAFVASLSIAGVPLTNGFASKWSIFVPTILGTRDATHLAICGAIAIVTSALTLALAMKFFGSAFLSRTSDLVRRRAGEANRLEVGPAMLVPQLTLAALCVALGLLPFLGSEAAKLAIAGGGEGLVERLAGPGGILTAGWAGAPLPDGRALLAPLGLAGVLGLAFLAAWATSRIGGGGRRQAPSWLCGYAMEADVHRYRARGLYSDMKRYFRWFGGGPGRPRQPAQVRPSGEDGAKRA